MQTVQFRRQESRDSNLPGQSQDGTANAPGDDDDEVEENEQHYDENGYDQAVIRLRETDWLSNCRVIGLNPDTDNAFISGPGDYEDHGTMYCETGDDPNAQGVDIQSLTCYSEAVPFHWDCYLLLCQRLTGSHDIDQINKTALYQAMDSVMEWDEPVLKLDYIKDLVDVDFCTNEQAWDSRAGQEFFVCSPMQTAEISSLRAELFRRTFTLSAPNSELGAKVTSDPFIKLPQEITDHVLSYLCEDDLLNFLQASWHAHFNTHYNEGFWKLYIINRMPWFFELHDFLQQDESNHVKSMKALFLWVYKTVKPREGIVGPLMRIANRRRIWYVCEQLASSYFAGLEDIKEVSSLGS